MEEGLYKNKYRIKSTRLEGWNYNSDGWYFITVCAKDRKIIFGEIESGEMRLNKIGEIIGEEILKTGKIRKNVRIDKWVVMPNHVHMMVIITGNDVETPRRGVSTKGNPKWQPNSLGSIINQIKSVCTKRIWQLGYIDFAWQAGYYEHVIRGDDDYQNIGDYIEYNPDKWEWDKNNPKNINK